MYNSSIDEITLDQEQQQLLFINTLEVFTS